MRRGSAALGVFGILAILLVLACESKPAQPPPTGKFPCGNATCDAHSSYCETQPSATPGEPEEHKCKPLPAQCAGAHDCSCFPADTPCVLFKRCQTVSADDHSTGFVVACPG